MVMACWRVMLSPGRALPSLPRYTPAALSFKMESSQRFPAVSEKVPAGAADWNWRKRSRMPAKAPRVMEASGRKDPSS